MKVLLALLLVIPWLPAHAGQPGACTPGEMQTSSAYWNDDGTPRNNVYAFLRPPKKCISRKPRYEYACPAAGSSAAIQFFQENSAALTFAAARSADVYDLTKRLEAAGQVRGTGRYVTDAGGTKIHRTNKVLLPAGGAVETYLEPGTGLAFSVSVQATAKTAKKTVYLAFRGTPEGWKSWLETNLPHQFNPNDAPMYSLAVDAAVETMVAMQRAFGVQAYCAVPLVITGHSLGGGLALHSALRAPRGNCLTKKTFVVAFDPALSTFGKLTGGEQLGRGSLALAAIFQDQWEPISEGQSVISALSPFALYIDPEDASDILTDISRDAQVVLFANVRADTVLNGDNPAGMLHPLEAHSMPRMLAMLQDTAQLIGHGDGRVGDIPAARICSWYEAVPNKSRR